MTTRPDDDNHHEHAHLDGGRCLDGTGRTWEVNADERARLVAQWTAGQASGATRALILPPNSTERRLDRLAREVLLLTLAVVLLAACVVVFAADRAGLL